MKVKCSDNDYKFEEPKCFTPNTSLYPLCKGACTPKEFSENDCIHCCLYENMFDDGGYSYYEK